MRTGRSGRSTCTPARRWRFTDADLTLACAYGTHAALAITSVRSECNLRDALMTRQTIGTAVGLLMARRRIGPDRAFHVLRRASQDRNVKVRDVARWLVETGQDLPPAPRRRTSDAAARRAEAAGGAPLLRIEPRADDRPGFRLVGELDLSSREHLAEAVAGLHACGGDVHLDLSELRFIDVAAARLLVRAADRLHESGGTRLLLHRPPPVLVQVARLLLNERELSPSDPLVLPYCPEPAVS